MSRPAQSSPAQPGAVIKSSRQPRQPAQPSPGAAYGCVWRLWPVFSCLRLRHGGNDRNLLGLGTLTPHPSTLERHRVTIVPSPCLWSPCYRGLYYCPVSRPDHRSYDHLSSPALSPPRLALYALLTMYLLLPMTAQLTQKWSGTQQLPSRNSGA